MELLRHRIINCPTKPLASQRVKLLLCHRAMATPEILPTAIKLWSRSSFPPLLPYIIAVSFATQRNNCSKNFSYWRQLVQVRFLLLFLQCDTHPPYVRCTPQHQETTYVSFVSLRSCTEPTCFALPAVLDGKTTRADHHVCILVTEPINECPLLF